MPITINHDNGVYTLVSPTQAEIDAFNAAHPYGTFIMRRGPAGIYPVAILNTHSPTTGAAVANPTLACVCPEYEDSIEFLFMQIRASEFKSLDTPGRQF